MLSEKDEMAWKQYMNGRVEMKKFDPDYDDIYLVRVVERLAMKPGHHTLFQYISNSVEDFNKVKRDQEAYTDRDKLRDSIEEKISVLDDTERFDYCGELDARTIAQMGLLGEYEDVSDLTSRYMMALNRRMGEPGYQEEWQNNCNGVLDFAEDYKEDYDLRMI